MAKYWLANNPNGEVTDAQVIALKSLGNLDLDEVDDLVAALPVPAIVDAADAADLLTKFNTLLGALRTAGILTA